MKYMRMLKCVFCHLIEKLNRSRFTTCPDQVILIGDNFAHRNWWRTHETQRVLKDHLCLADSRGAKSTTAPSIAIS